MGASSDRGSNSIRGFLHQIDKDLNFVDACYDFPETNVMTIDKSYTALDHDITET